MQNPNLDIPVGTKVVTRTEVPARGYARPKGSVAVVVRTPDGDEQPYVVRFADGAESKVVREDVAILKHYQRADWAHEDVSEASLKDHVIYKCVVGSRAYGLVEATSDTDIRGIYLPSASMHWSMWGVPGQLEDKRTDEVYWELEKFLKLALKANPNILECLYTPLVLYAGDLARELLDMREAFLSELVYQTYNRYVMSQFKKLEKRRQKTGEVKPKHAMHLVRLLIAGIQILEEGFVPVDVGPHRERLLAIKTGELPWEDVDQWRLALHEKFDAAFRRSSLPERPDYERVNAFLIAARRSAVEDESGQTEAPDAR
ncbi:MAG: nucleotidyltransferase domain-containing protein [Myxococcota bacterium]